MSRKSWVILVAVLLAGAGGIAFAVWFANRRAAEGEAAVMVGGNDPAARQAFSQGRAPVERVQGLVNSLDAEYVRLASAAPITPEAAVRMGQILRSIQAIRRLYPTVSTSLRNV